MILSAILGLVPIAIAAVAGSALMVLSGALNMQETYQAIVHHSMTQKPLSVTKSKCISFLGWDKYTIFFARNNWDTGFQPHQKMGKSCYSIS